MTGLTRHLIIVVLSVVLVGCAGSGNRHDTPANVTPAQLFPLADSIALPPPGAALDSLGTRAGSALLLELPGDAYEPGLAQRVSIEATSARFSPAWTGNSSGFDTVAYASYNFNVQTYHGPEVIRHEWGDAPIDYTQVWIGLANWPGDFWDWYPATADGILDLQTIGYSDYTRPATGDMLVAIVVLGTLTPLLDNLQVGEFPGEPISITGIAPDIAQGISGSNVGFDVLFTGTVDGTTTYEWDFGGGAVPNNPQLKAPSVTLGAVGTYDCSVSVGNAYGPPDTHNFTLSVYTERGDWWMRGHDPQHTGRSIFTGPATNALKWSYATGDMITSSPAISADGTIYVGSWDNKLYALNPDGSLKWAYETLSWVESSPAIGTDGTVYVGSNDDNLYAINPDGSLKWAFTAGDWVSSSPAIGPDGTIYVGCEDDLFYAINPDGILKWTYTTEDWVVSSPAIGLDGNIYVGSDDGKLHAISPAGNQQWAFDTGDYITSSPAIAADGTVYVGSWDYKLYAINLIGTKKWEYDTGDLVESSPAIGADGTVYVGTWDAELIALDPDGSLKWTYPTGYAVTSSPAIDAEGTIYVGSWDNKLHAINPDGSQKWEYSAADWISSSPAIGPDGTVYVGSDDGKLYAFGPGGSHDQGGGGDL